MKPAPYRRIVIDSRIPGLEARLKAFPGVEVKAMEGKDITASDVREADCLFVRTRTRCDSSLLGGSGVRLVGTATIGTDHIDIPWCESHGIRVVSAPGCNAPAVMQYVASSLSLAGFDPRRHTLGVVGKGHIGSLVARLYRDAGAQVLVCDPPRRDAGHADENYLELGEVLRRSDAVTFHVPYTKEGPYPTHHLLYAGMKTFPDIIVNASRGGVVDSRVLLDATCRSRFIIDTWEFEDNPHDWASETRRALLGRAFIATPHIAGYSIEGKRRATEAMLAAFVGSAPEEKRDGMETLTFPYALRQAAASFNPVPLSNTLKSDPSQFETLRASHLRHEPPAKTN